MDKKGRNVIMVSIVHGYHEEQIDGFNFHCRHNPNFEFDSTKRLDQPHSDTEIGEFYARRWGIQSDQVYVTGSTHMPNSGFRCVYFNKNAAPKLQSY